MSPLVDLFHPAAALRAFAKTFLAGCGRFDRATVPRSRALTPPRRRYGIRAGIDATRVTLDLLRRAVVLGQSILQRRAAKRLARATASPAAARTGAWLGASVAAYLLLCGGMLRLRGHHDAKASGLAGAVAGSLVLIERGTARRRARWDVALFAAVRAADMLVRLLVRRGALPHVAGFPALLFMASTARIMWAWFYHPGTLSPLYRKWISRMADMDPRLLDALRALRVRAVTLRGRGAKLPTHHHLMPPPRAQAGKVAYGAPSDMLAGYARDHGLPPWTADPQYGLLSCNVVHPGRSCAGNAATRFLRGAGAAAAMYAPLYTLPMLLFGWREARRAPLRAGARTAANVARSSSFIGLFIAVIWYSVCRVRGALRNDTALGPLLGCLLCGGAVTVERPARRLELALYVLPRAIESAWRQLRTQGAVPRLPYGDVAAVCASTGVVMYCFERDPGSMQPALWGAINTFFGWV